MLTVRQTLISLRAPVATLAAFVAFAAGVSHGGEGQEAALDLLRRSTQAVEAAPTLSCEFAVRIRVVMDDQQQESNAEYHYAKHADGRFFFRPNSEEMKSTRDGIAVAGTGSATLTHIPSISRYVIEESDEGITALIRSPLSRGIGNGLGGMALSFLSLEGAEDMIEQISDAEDLGVEEVDGESLRRCRYTLNDQMSFDVWYSAGDQPWPVRIEPDLEAMAAEDPATEQFEVFEYKMTFAFEGWKTEPLNEHAYAIIEPPGSQLVRSFFEGADDRPHPLLGRPAPSVELNNLAGESVNLADHIGKDVVLLDFWATWCPPCVAAMPKIDHVAESFAERGVVFFAVNEQETAEQVTAFLAAKGLTPPVLLDTGMGPGPSLADGYMVEGLPTTVLIGKEGTVQAVHVGLGETLEEELTSELEALVSGVDLAARAAEEREAQLARDREELDRLRDLLYE